MSQSAPITIFPLEYTAKLDLVMFNIECLKSQNIYTEEAIEAIDFQSKKIYNFLHSSKCDNIQEIITNVIQQLSRNLERHNFIEVLKPYEVLFNDYIIKIRSFPVSILNEDDSEIIKAFHKQFKSTLSYLVNRQNTFHAFEVLHSLNFSITKFTNIIGKLIRSNINDDYYQVLNQTNENLINLQNVLNLAYEIENDCHTLIDLNEMIIRNIPKIQEALQNDDRINPNE